MKPKINIELSDHDASLFISFQKNYNNIKKLIDNNVFAHKSKTLILHIDSFGNINGIEMKIKLG